MAIKDREERIKRLRAESRRIKAALRHRQEQVEKARKMLVEAGIEWERP